MLLNNCKQSADLAVIDSLDQFRMESHACPVTWPGLMSASLFLLLICLLHHSGGQHAVTLAQVI